MTAAPFLESTAERPFLDKATPAMYKALLGLSKSLRDSAKEAGVSQDLVELVNLRSSQINGCPYCLSVHTPKAKAAGLTDLQIALLPAWRDASVYSEEQRAALAIAEAVTRVVPSSEMDDVVTGAVELLGAERYSVLSWAAITINSFNRLSIVSRHPVKEPVA
jgi:AhpD family alkylhydroperoxidase